ncbi:MULTISPECIES: DUF1292 domain-containing protein [Paenibacillus]|uniref:DUF1292 domain-containing protein n=2 Tax=Paenibacillus TaxID=44249 RepID=A0ABT4DLF2_9BACL|nr:MULTISPECIES: DUF1292 domain-containing protein [Paenibacillus]MBN3526008.1 DUF1292 domain-containing protein [Paenibacillus apiarius]MCE5167881.1 DUF1292 domain-containing protein [Paenibacillus profundus]MCM3337129.1 DUF1292 domain-containing protein [Paenibacillus sp. MER TA 81-3]MCY9513633.1 DUF1292 domain-containing protein [Paenibacillus apiarius]MCY9518184.1 DUF1292 domain-containing protein [Paenibacillus apiarius]
MSEHNHDCGCGHDHDHDHEHQEMVVTLVDDEGNEIDMALVETFNVGEQLYALLLERNNPEADGIIVRVDEEDEDMVLNPIEDDEEWERVQQAYEELVAAQPE